MMILVQKRMYQPLMKNRLYLKRKFKYIFPVCGLIVLCVVFFGIGSRNHLINDSLDLINISYASNLKYGGQNKKGKPFNIQSERGAEVSEKEVVFEQIKADIDMKKGEILKIEANKGVFNKMSKDIALNGNVQLKHANGLTLYTTEATINLESGLAHNSAPIEGHNDRAKIKANGFRIESENQIVFLGQPELTIRTY